MFVSRGIDNMPYDIGITLFVRMDSNLFGQTYDMSKE